MGDDSEVKKAKGTKISVIKRELMFENYKDCLFNGKAIIKKKKRCHHQKVYAEVFNKIALTNDNDKRLQTFIRVTTSIRNTAC